MAQKIGHETVVIERGAKVVRLGKEDISWHETHMNIAEEMSRRSHCLQVSIGAVIAKMIPGREKILATGYNGPPRKIPNCDSVGCGKIGADGEPLPDGCCRGAHAEMNAIVNAANEGVAIDGATLYCTLSPCLECAKHIINSGMIMVIWKKMYSDHFPGKEKEAQQAIDMIRKSKVGITIMSYENALGKDVTE